MRLLILFTLIFCLWACKGLEVQQLQKCDNGKCTITTLILDEGKNLIFYENKVTVDSDMAIEAVMAEWRKADALIEKGIDKLGR